MWLTGLVFLKMFNWMHDLWLDISGLSQVIKIPNFNHFFCFRWSILCHNNTFICSRMSTLKQLLLLILEVKLIANLEFLFIFKSFWNTVGVASVCCFVNSFTNTVIYRFTVYLLLMLVIFPWVYWTIGIIHTIFFSSLLLVERLFVLSCIMQLVFLAFRGHLHLSEHVGLILVLLHIWG